MGFDVMTQVPLAQPINFQYKNPATPPKTTPITTMLYFLSKFILNMYSCYAKMIQMAKKKSDKNHIAI